MGNAARIIDEVGVLDDTVAATLQKGLERLEFSSDEDSLKSAIRLLSVAAISKGDRVLILGIADGHLTALANACGVAVFCVEHDGIHLQRVRKKIDDAQCAGAVLVSRRLMMGFSEYAPFDSIISQKIVEEVPSRWFEQLSTESGKLVVPIQTKDATQLFLFEKSGESLQKIALESW